MEHFIEWVQNWGYVAVFLGSLVEGESVILTATFLAYNGYLSLPKIMVVAFIGTFLAEQSCYAIGRYYGAALFDKFPKIKPKAEKAFVLLKKWDVWFILTCRFIYGIRTISPIVIGAAGIPPKRYLPLNLLAALIWVVISCVGGYMLGGAVEKILHNLHEYKYHFLTGFLLITGAGITLVHYVSKCKSKTKEVDSVNNGGKNTHEDYINRK